MEAGKPKQDMRVFFPRETPPALKFVVVAANENGQWLYVRQRSRLTYEIPGGHIEEGETPAQAARRELFEETGTRECMLWPVCLYGVEQGGVKTYGALFYAEVHLREELPNGFEMEECIRRPTLPQMMTYPAIQPLLQKKAEQFRREKE